MNILYSLVAAVLIEACLYLPIAYIQRKKRLLFLRVSGGRDYKDLSHEEIENIRDRVTAKLPGSYRRVEIVWLILHYPTIILNAIFRIDDIEWYMWLGPNLVILTLLFSKLVFPG